MDEASTHDSDVVLSVAGATKAYGRHVVLDDITFDVRRGAHVLFLGPNGAGKTTLLKCIMGLIDFKGSVRVGGLDVKKQAREAKKGMGYVPQSYALYDNLSVLEHARFATKLKGAGEDQIEEKLKMFELWDARKKRVGSLSSGMRQRLAISFALLNDPGLILLDEPTSNVDHKGQLDFKMLVERLLASDKTVVTTTHLPGLSEVVNEVKVIDRGKVIAHGSPEELLKNMKAKDTIYLRVDGPDSEKALGLVRSIVGDGVHKEGSWIVFAVRTDEKLRFLQRLAQDGLSLEDVRISPATIETDYFQLLGGASQ